MAEQEYIRRLQQEMEAERSIQLEKRRQEKLYLQKMMEENEKNKAKQKMDEERQRIEDLKAQEEYQRMLEKQENDRLLKQLDEGRNVLVDQAKGRVSAELDKAKAAYKSAYESGDSDALLAAQEQLTILQNEKVRYDNYKPEPRPEPAPQPQYQQQTPQPPRPSERALEWAKKNDWFEKDSEMTGYAYGLHQKLVQNGVAPDSEQYYNEIDAAVRRVFPEKFDDGSIEVSAPQRQAGNVVAPAARSGKKPRKIKLTSTQASLAKRLGLSNEQYAAQLMKEASK